MATITIPKKLAQNDDLVVIPKSEYKSLMKLKNIKEFKPTNTQKEALVKAERNFKFGKTMSYNELVRKLGFGS